MDAQTLNVRDTFEFTDEPVELVIFCYQRIATGENNFIEFGTCTDIIQRLNPVGLISLVVLIRKMTAETVAAVTAQPPFTSNRARLLYLCNRPGTTLRCSSSGSVVKPGAAINSSRAVNT